MPVTADQVGKLYDILIATRDGSTLACLDHNGRTQQVSQVAYMLSTTKPSAEATEIQRKDQLVQLASAQMIDRDFDAYPQVEQGDWSDGAVQRVFSGQGEALGTISNKSTRYWDGQGIIWPTTDYLPQRPVLATADQDQAGAVMSDPFNIGTISGNLVNFAGLRAFAYIYQRTVAPLNNILVIQGDGNKTTVTNPPDTSAGTATTADMVMFLDNILWVRTAVGTTCKLDTIDGAGTATNRVNLGGSSSFAGPGLLAASIVGNKPYVAFVWINNTTLTTNLQIIDLSTGSWTSASTPIPLWTSSSSVIPATPLQIEFMGDNVVLAAWDDQGVSIAQYNIPSGAWSTLARFPTAATASMCAIAGGLFVLAGGSSSQFGMPNPVEAYLIQGGAVQDIGPVVVQNTTGSLGSYIVHTSNPTVFGPYAIFSAAYFQLGNTGIRFAVFAYDVLRGRWFKLNDIGPYAQFSNGIPLSARLAILPPMINHPFGGGTMPAQWGVAVPVLSGLGAAADTTNVQRLLMAVTSSTSAFQPLLQQGVQITSSLIDFTSGQNKLYRQLVADFTPLPNDAAITVQLDCWFDQDPSALAGVPDFTTGAVAGSGANIGLKQLRLVTNKIARKVVYRITTTGPSTTPTGAVKIISVKTQVATGWALHYFLDISRNAVCNDAVLGQGTYCFQNQAPVDDFAAHAFLKQLWRLKGGECVVTLPTGETYNALLQLISAENVKHVIQSGLSDTPVVKSVIVELKIREDV